MRSAYRVAYGSVPSRRSTSRSYAPGAESARNAPSSSGVGGSPVRSMNTRRHSVAGSASGPGATSAAASRACTKRSIGCPGASASAASGGVGGVAARGASNAQCGSYRAPSRIQRTTVARSASVNACLPLSGGGMTASGSRVRSRRTACEPAGSPGTIAAPCGRVAVAASNESSRRPACCFARSGPWHRKHRSDRMGRTSRPYRRGSSCEGPGVAAVAPVRPLPAPDSVPDGDTPCPTHMRPDTTTATAAMEAERSVNAGGTGPRRPGCGDQRRFSVSR